MVTIRQMTMTTTTTTGNEVAAIVEEENDTDLSVAAVVADMTAAGAFGPGAVLLSYEPDGGRHAGQDQFASIVHYGTATVDPGRGPCRRRLVIKLKHRLANVRELLNNDAQFHNEMHFYERMLPSLLAHAPTDRAPSLCRYVYGRNDCGRHVCRDAIVLENACGPPLHYRQFGHRLDLDLDHAVVALSTLAKWVNRVCV